MTLEGQRKQCESTASTEDGIKEIQQGDVPIISDYKGKRVINLFVISNQTNKAQL